MSIKYYMDADGNVLGAFSTKPSGSTVIPDDNLPPSGQHVFQDGAWVLPASALSATGRDLIAAAERMEGSGGLPADLSDQLAAFVVGNPKLQLAWTPNDLMRRSAPEIVGIETEIGTLIGVDGAGLLDDLFVEAIR